MLLVYTLVKTSAWGWGSSRTIALLVASVALIAAFVLIESRTQSPLMPLRILRNRSVASADAVGLLVGAALLSMFFFLSLYLQQVLHYSALRTGVSYLPLAVGIIIAPGLASGLTTRIGAKVVLIAGLVGARRRDGLVQQPAYARQVRQRRVAAVADRRLGPRILLRATDHPRGERYDRRRRATRLGPDQHRHAGGGSDRPAVLATIATSRTDHLLRAAPGAHSALPGALTDGFSRASIVGAGFAIIGIVLAVLFIKNSRPAAGGETASASAEASLATAAA